MMQNGRMVYSIEIQNNGRREIVDFEGPDGLSDDQITQLADQHLRTARPGQRFPGSILDPRQQQRQQQPAPPEITSTAPSESLARNFGPASIMSGAGLAADTLAGAAQGVGHVLDNTAGLAQGAYNQTLGRLFGQSDSATQTEQSGQGFEGTANNLGQGNSVGNALGQIGASTYLTRRLPGPVMQGGGSGAVMSDAENITGLARDMALGGIGGYLLDRASRGISGLVAPQIDNAVRQLHNRGVRMTPGQIMPGLNRWEEMAISRPGIGRRIERGRQQSFTDLQRAAVDEVVAPYNAVGSTPVAIPANANGRGVIRAVGDQLSNRYEQLIPRLRLTPDRQLATDIRRIGASLNNGDLSPAAVQQFYRIIQNQITPQLRRPALRGRDFRQVERRLGRQIRRYSSSEDPDHQALANAFEDMQSAFQRGLQRSNPGHATELRGLNESWANLVRVEGAGTNARNGLFTPAQLATAVRRADTSVRGRAVARGEARMQDLSDAAVDVLPNEYPNSRTADRMQMGMGNLNFWQGAVQGLGYGQPVQRGFQNLLLAPRPPAAQSIADIIRALPAPQAGAFGLDALVSPFLGSIPQPR